MHVPVGGSRIRQVGVQQIPRIVADRLPGLDIDYIPALLPDAEREDEIRGREGRDASDVEFPEMSAIGRAVDLAERLPRPGFVFAHAEVDPVCPVLHGRRVSGQVLRRTACVQLQEDLQAIQDVDAEGFQGMVEEEFGRRVVQELQPRAVVFDGPQVAIGPQVVYSFCAVRSVFAL